MYRLADRYSLLAGKTYFTVPPKAEIWRLITTNGMKIFNNYNMINASVSRGSFYVLFTNYD
jgi:hypothetical protein